MRTIAAICLFSFCGFFTTASAQLSKEQQKERKELRKSSRSELNERAGKTARKEARKYEKEGWMTVPGALPLEKQLDRAYMMQLEYDEDMYPKYLMGEGMSVGENYDAAKMQATELARLQIVEQFQTEITALVENSVANQALSAEEAASVTKTIMASKGMMSQSLGRTIVVVEAYRTLKNKNKEVLLRLAYNGGMAKAIAKKALRESLQNEGDELQKKLDEVLGK